jgi:hypothetical protein
MFGNMFHRFVVGMLTLGLALSFVEVTEASQGGAAKAGGGKAGISNTVAKGKGGKGKGKRKGKAKGKRKGKGKGKGKSKVAKGKRGGKGHYYVSYGTKFKHGYYFKGKDHRQWSYCYWNARYRCYFFYEPDLCSYYYWCASQNCYYPVTYITIAPPVAGDVLMPAGIKITVTATAAVTTTATAIVGSGAPAPGPAAIMDQVKDGLKEDQAPRLSGQETKRDLKFDPDAAALLGVALQIPPVKAADKLSLERLPPYPKAALAGYGIDDKDNQLRKTIKEAVALLVKHNNAFRERFPALPTDAQKANAFKSQIQNQQQDLALVYAALDAKYEELKALRENRDRETKYWQANFDYVMARLGFRLAQFIEYQVMLGQIRKDELPRLNKQKHTGYRLRAKINLTDREGAKIAADAKKLLKKIAEEHKGTPWELLAKREMMVALGLEWLPD